MEQPRLEWDDKARIPDEYVRFFEETGRCVNCGQPLGCHQHALNHWALLHTVKEKPRARRRTSKPPSTVTTQEPRYRYLAWKPNANDGKGEWRVVSKDTYDACRRDGRPATMRINLDVAERLAITRKKAA